MAIQWPLCYVLPRRHTDIPDHGWGAQRPDLKSDRMAMRIFPQCQLRDVLLGVTQVRLLWFVISPCVMGTQLEHISTIEDWPTSEAVWNVQMLLGFTIFYRWFIRTYEQVTTQISDLLKTAETSRTLKNPKWEWTWNVEIVFRKLKGAFTHAPIVNRFVPGKPMTLQTDVEGFAIRAIQNQCDGFGILGAVNV